MFICWSHDGLVTTTGQKHNASAISALVLAVEPMKFVYGGQMAVFSICMFHDECIFVIAEQQPGCSKVSCLKVC